MDERTVVPSSADRLEPAPAGIPLTAGATPWSDRASLRALQVGVVAVVLVVSTNKEFELDRFFVPKELILHLTALVAGLFALHSFRHVRLGTADLLLLGFVAVSAASAFLAGDREVAMRATAVSASGLAIFWTARGARLAGLDRPLLAAVAVAVVVGCVTSLLQTYGVRVDLFSINRAPGGTLGNRNFVAHLAAIGLPVLLYCALRAWRAAGYLAWTAGVMLVAGTLVLTRSRAGWLAALAVLIVMGGAMLLSPPLRRHGRSWRRIVGIFALAAAGVAGSLLLPNTLRWRSDSPYLETVRAVANYQEGSGAGRLVQYRRSLEMTIDHPLLGVGPGNWPAEYPGYAAAGDPSLSRSNPGTTANPWPSSDWVAFASERGLPATILILVALSMLALGGLRRMSGARDAEEGLAASVLTATVAATLVAGAFDAVLLLAVPTLVVWAALGAVSPASDATAARPWKGWAAALALVVLVVVAGYGTYLSATRLLAMGL